MPINGDVLTAIIALVFCFFMPQAAQWVGKRTATSTRVLVGGVGLALSYAGIVMMVVKDSTLVNTLTGEFAVEILIWGGYIASAWRFILPEQPYAAASWGVVFAILASVVLSFATAGATLSQWIPFTLAAVFVIGFYAIFEKFLTSEKIDSREKPKRKNDEHRDTARLAAENQEDYGTEENLAAIIYDKGV